MRMTLLATTVTTLLMTVMIEPAALAASQNQTAGSDQARGAAKNTSKKKKRHAAGTERVKQLNAIHVTAVPLGERADELVVPVSVLSGVDLDNARSGTIGDTVSKVPGVQTTSLGQAVGRPVIRGLGGPRITITENGLGSEDVSNVSQDHAVTIEPFLADQIEVLKGPSTLLYGSGAIGGVVNAVDGRIPEKAPEDAVSGRAEMRYDSASEGKTGMFRLDTGNDRMAFHVDGLRRDDGDYNIPGGKLSNSYVKTDSGAFGGSLLGDWGYLGGSVSRYLNNYGSPAEPGNPAEGEPPVHLQMAQTRYDLKGGFNAPFAGVRKLEVNVDRTNYQHVEYEGDAPGTTFSNDSNEGRMVLTHQPLAGWNGAVGVQYLHRDFAAVGDETFVPPTTTKSAGVFITEQHVWGPFKLQLGARLDHQTSSPQGGAERSFRPKSFSSGAAWRFNDHWRLTFNLDRAQRAPAEEELFANGPHDASATFEVGNPGLNAETANQTELGLHYAGERLDARLSVYNNRFNDFIYLADTGQEEDGLPVRDWSQANARFRGAEAELTAHLAKNAYGHWDWHVFGDTVRATLAGGGNVPRIPAGRLGSDLRWGAGNWRASVGAVRYFRQDQTAQFETGTAGFTQVTAHLGWTFHNGMDSQWEAFLDGKNLANQTERLATSLFKDESPLPGRSISVGVRAWF